MSPSFTPDFADVKAGFRTLDRGEYELILGQPKGFSYVKDDGTHVVGVRFPTNCAAQVMSDGSLDDKYEGDSVSPIRLYLHTEGAFRMTKQFLLAACGYSISEEDAADEEFFSDADFSVDVDDEDEENHEVTLGAAWDGLKGNRVRVTADIQMYNDKPSQNWQTWLPVK
jgi:hypothetical protein